MAIQRPDGSWEMDPEEDIDGTSPGMTSAYKAPTTPSSNPAEWDDDANKPTESMLANFKPPAPAPVPNPEDPATLQAQRDLDPTENYDGTEGAYTPEAPAPGPTEEPGTEDPEEPETPAPGPALPPPITAPSQLELIQNYFNDLLKGQESTWKQQLGDFSRRAESAGNRLGFSIGGGGQMSMAGAAMGNASLRFGEQQRQTKLAMIDKLISQGNFDASLAEQKRQFDTGQGNWEKGFEWDKEKFAGQMDIQFKQLGLTQQQINLAHNQLAWDKDLRNPHNKAILAQIGLTNAQIETMGEQMEMAKEDQSWRQTQDMMRQYNEMIAGLPPNSKYTPKIAQWVNDMEATYNIDLNNDGDNTGGVTTEDIISGGDGADIQESWDSGVFDWDVAPKWDKKTNTKQAYAERGGYDREGSPYSIKLDGKDYKIPNKVKLVENNDFDKQISRKEALAETEKVAKQAIAAVGGNRAPAWMQDELVRFGIYYASKYGKVASKDKMKAHLKSLGWDTLFDDFA